MGQFVHQSTPLEVPYSQSSYVPDSIINPHPRFAALVQNIRNRRGGKVDIQVPLFRDQFTPEFLRENYKNGHDKRDEKDGHSFELEVDTNIHMDAMAFGMGMCCLVIMIKTDKILDDDLFVCFIFFF